MAKPICTCGKAMAFIGLTKSDAAGLIAGFICLDHPFNELWEPFSVLHCPNCQKGVMRQAVHTKNIGKLECNACPYVTPSHVE